MAVGSVDGALVVLAVIGGLELIDRTSFALIALSARSRALGAWAGGASAFVLTTVISVAVGAGIEAWLGMGRIVWVRLAGGIFLLAYASFTLLRQAKEAPTPIVGVRGAFAAAFLTIFLLELGDTTMIFEIVFVPTFGWLVVLVGGAAGLVAVAAWDVWLGQRLSVRLRPRTVQRVVATILFVVGTFTIVYALAPALFPAL
ncbi:MAG TPA: TMEM165/GDT1 family protein [Thermoplasmata archaeon]|nr:TMEM165/GDT1 family protein [Thermoplasmata archaeon]